MVIGTDGDGGDKTPVDSATTNAEDDMHCRDGNDANGMGGVVLVVMDSEMVGITGL